MEQFESRVDQAKRFAKIWWKSRADADKSQEYMALGIGVSKKTIQNWEKGVSSPDLFQSIEWFRLLAQNPLHYYLEFLYPSLFESEDCLADEGKTEEALIVLIKQASLKEKQQLLYLMTGKHGSSWYALLQMFTAHCHTTMQSRTSVARLILENYEIEEQSGRLVCPEAVQPDIPLLESAIDSGKEAAGKNENKYAPPKM